MDKRKVLIRKAAKYLIYAFAVFLLYILQSVPGFLKIFGVKPVFIIPFCVALSVYDEDWRAGFVYVFGGLLADLSSGRVAGYITIMLLICCVVCVVAVKFLVKPSNRNVFMLSFAVMFIIFTYDFLLTYIMRGYKNFALFYIKNVLLFGLYSSVFAVPFYMLISKISNYKFLRTETR